MDTGSTGSNGTGEIYRPPQSEVLRSSETSEAGGSIERTLAGDFEFDIASIIREAWALTNGSKGPILAGVFVAYMINFGVNFISQQMAGDVTDNITPDQGGILVGGSLIASLLMTPLSAGVMLFAIKRAAGDPTASSGDVVSCYDRVFPLFVLLIVQSLLTFVGFLFFILPGIYLAVSYSLAIPLLVERRMGIWESLETSRKVVGQCWWSILGLYLLVSLAGMAAVLLTLLIGAIWVLPLGFLCLGIVYRNLVGYQGSHA